MQAKANEFLNNNNKYLKIQIQTNKICKREKYDDLQKIKDRTLQSHQCYHCHWDSSSSQLESPCPCVHKFPIQFSIRLGCCMYPLWLWLVYFIRGTFSTRSEAAAAGPRHVFFEIFNVLLIYQTGSQFRHIQYAATC